MVFDSEKQEWIIDRPEIRLEIIGDTPHANKNPLEHYAVLGQQYMENSEKFAHNYDFKYPGLYEFFQNNVFEGREYENYQCVSGCPGN